MTLCRIIVNAEKRAVSRWADYQKRKPTADEWQAMKQHRAAYGEAVVCGAVSGGLEVIDVDAKYDLSGVLKEELLGAIPADILSRLTIIETGGQRAAELRGLHLYYLCERIEGNQPLARRPASDAEQEAKPGEKVKVLIETRGEGGYVVAPPTPGYTRIGGPDEPGRITSAERDTLFAICRAFNQYVKEDKPPVSVRAGAVEKYHKSPFDDYNERGAGHMIETLQAHGWKVVQERGARVMLKRPGDTDAQWSGDWNRDLNLFGVFSTSTVFDTGKGYKPAAVFCKLECGDDWKACAVKLSGLGYGESKNSPARKSKDIVRKIAERGGDIDRQIQAVHKMTGVGLKAAAEMLEQIEADGGGEDTLTFWKVSDKGAVSLDRPKLYQWLHSERGFGLYWVNNDLEGEYRIVRIERQIISEASTEQMIKVVHEYLSELPDIVDDVTPNDIMGVFIEETPKTFSASMLEHLPRVLPELMRHRVDVAYFPFNNGVAVVNKTDAVKVIPYNELHGAIWKRQIIKHRFDPDPDFIFSLEDCEYYQFLKRVCGEDDRRVSYAMQLIGYALHQFKNPARAWAVILCEETEDENQGGGTGKGIFFKAIGKCINTLIIDGKNFTMDKGFAMQRVEVDTQLIAIEDVRKGLNMERFYSMITEGVTVEKKHKAELYLPYAQAPKFGFSTNYTVEIDGNHGARRVKLLEFSGYFGKHRTPADEFGHNMFDDWDSDEWNRFYNLMMYCVQLYLIQGVQDMEQSGSLVNKGLRMEFGEEFVVWAEHHFKDGLPFTQGAKDTYDGFLRHSGLSEKEYTQNRFSRSLKKIAMRYQCKIEVSTVGKMRCYTYVSEK